MSASDRSLLTERDDRPVRSASTRWVAKMAPTVVERIMLHDRFWPGEGSSRILIPDAAMIHGYATPQGVYVPNAGVRIFEDTATLISPDRIERFVLPRIERAAAPFGGALFHFCGCLEMKELWHELTV